MIDILSRHLYSEEKVFIRELLQNATDAISARQQLGKEFDPVVNIEIVPPGDDTPGQLLIEDNGIGLTEEEVHSFLSSIGSSSKKEDLLARRQQFIGQFGIGLLSCFMVTDEIAMVTCSAKDPQALEWRGRSDGSYSVKKLEGSYEPGTRVFITARDGKNRYFETESVEKNATFYGELLPFPVHCASPEGKKQLNHSRPPWERQYATEAQEREAYLHYGRQQFGTDFLDYIKIKTEIGNTRGVAWVLPHEVSPSARASHKVYLRNMLVSEKADNILPEWAFFVKCIINSQTLRPTASRESFYEDAALAHTRRQLGSQLKQFLIDLEQHNPEQLKRLYAIHYHTMNSLALHDDDFFKIIINYVPFETAEGDLTLPEYEKRSEVIRHIANIDEFRQISGIAHAQNIPIINSGYTYKSELLEKYASLFPRKNVVQVSVDDFVESFDELAPTENEQISWLLSIANSELADYRCSAIAKSFLPENVPALFVKDEFSSLWRSISKSKDVSDNLWGGILDNLAEAGSSNSDARVCFNYRNPLIRKMAVLKDEERLRLYIRIMYVQALLLGHHPLQAQELQILSSGLSQLLNQGLKR